jgi:hypothetical protein
MPYFCMFCYYKSYPFAGNYSCFLRNTMFSNYNINIFFLVCFNKLEVLGLALLFLLHSFRLIFRGS